MNQDASLAIPGRMVGQFFAAKRELYDRNRQLRVDLSLDGWRSIELGANRTDQEAMRCLERALGDIQLRGTPPQVDGASPVTPAMAAGSRNPPALASDADRVGRKGGSACERRRPCPSGAPVPEGASTRARTGAPRAHARPALGAS